MTNNSYIRMKFKLLLQIFNSASPNIGDDKGRNYLFRHCEEAEHFQIARFLLHFKSKGKKSGQRSFPRDVQIDGSNTSRSKSVYICLITIRI